MRRRHFGIANTIYATEKGVGSVRSEDELRDMLKEASALRDSWLQVLTDKAYKDNSEMVEAIRNYNALRGVIKTLHWALRHPLAVSPLH